jgi:hypothetical protein
MFQGAPCSGPGLLKCLSCTSGHYGRIRGPGVVFGNFAFAAAERHAVDLFLPVSNEAARGNGLIGSDCPWEVLCNLVLESRLSPVSARLAGGLPKEFPVLRRRPPPGEGA